MPLFEASFRTVLQTIAILVLLYYLFKFAFRLFAPILITKVAKKAEESFRQKQQQYYQNQQSHNQNQQTQQQEADLNRQFAQNKFPKEKKKVGEYIDFEEIE